MDSDAIALMMMDDSIQSMSRKPSSGFIGTCIDGILKAKSEKTSEFQLPRATGLFKIDCVLHVPKIAHSLSSVPGLCKDGHTVQLTANSCVIKMREKSWMSAGV